MHYAVEHGGLMRCCLATLQEHMAGRTKPPEEGETLSCKYEKPDNKNMIFTGGVWRWNREQA